MRTSARRAGAVAVIAAGALLVSGCGSSDDKGGKDEGGGKPEASASKSAPEPTGKGQPDQPSGDASDGATGAPDDGSDDGADGGTGGRPGGSGKAGKLSGVWKAKGKQYVLTVVGDKVTLLRERGRNCTGSLGGSAGRTLSLKCPGGADEVRTDGTVGAHKGKSLTVSWKGGPREDYARVTDVPVKLPEE
ncbi:hypothetical protein HCC61_07475 [Streptomyces sp. HNM0575]|uniref:hypothetical protein n=1 Tax=Streptomyces sp. HNM0575 TaxID=2716338 RepID=UPI00145E36A7|nr:hypothetical protein [Streptomyces sp. HNM0575]NLU72513.1 hypothetical protein [Streptomyces sp. HNM0575]